jgi:hypothetical protein
MYDAISITPQSKGIAMIYVIRANCEDGPIFAYGHNATSTAWCNLLATADRFDTLEAACRAAADLNAKPSSWHSLASVETVSPAMLVAAEAYRSDLEKQAEIEFEEMVQQYPGMFT